MLITIELQDKHVSKKINEKFVKDFVRLNGLHHSFKGKSKSIYDVNGKPTAIVASSKGYNIRQLEDDINHVICYSDKDKQWRLFSGEGIKRGAITRRDVGRGIAGRNCKLEGGALL